jgi:hypothetical protein
LALCTAVNGGREATAKGCGLAAVHHAGKLTAPAMATCRCISHKGIIAQPIRLALCHIVRAYISTAARNK